MNKKYRVGKVGISITTLENSIQVIEKTVERGSNAQVCVLDFNAMCYANTHPCYNNIVNNAILITPDGVPLIWLARLWGLKDVSQTMGPELFITILQRNKNGLRHFLLGDTDDILSRVCHTYKQKYQSNIVGSYSPPFIDVDLYDYLSIANIINDSNADIVWISMTSPKQDYLGAKLLPYLESKIVIGVGAAFRYSIGHYKMPKGFVWQIGLAGFMRKAGFWKELVWYIRYACLLLKYAAQIIYWRLSGRKFYE
jgi:N-acetylglucosaminyldiphosphoundecaprenol N-acetyl-beta-D-mannosaminyltransferase